MCRSSNRNVLDGVRPGFGALGFHACKSPARAIGGLMDPGYPRPVIAAKTKLNRCQERAKKLAVPEIAVNTLVNR